MHCSISYHASGQEGLAALDRGADDSARSLAARVTQLVNDAVSTVEPSSRLSQDEVLDLIDLGSAPGGSQAS